MEKKRLREHAKFVLTMERRDRWVDTIMARKKKCAKRKERRGEKRCKKRGIGKLGTGKCSECHESIFIGYRGVNFFLCNSCLDGQKGSIMRMQLIYRSPISYGCDGMGERRKFGEEKNDKRMEYSSTDSHCKNLSRRSSRQ